VTGFNDYMNPQFVSPKSGWNQIPLFGRSIRDCALTSDTGQLLVRSAPRQQILDLLGNGRFCCGGSCYRFCLDPFLLPS
jgi:hypothetical protein